MRYCLAFICVLSAFGSVAQKITISAKVIDKETREPLPFASVGILGKSIGTITNLQGDVDFSMAITSESVSIDQTGASNDL